MCPSADETLLSVKTFQPAAQIITCVSHIRDPERPEAAAPASPRGPALWAGPLPPWVSEVAAAMTSPSSALSIIIWHWPCFPLFKWGQAPSGPWGLVTDWDKMSCVSESQGWFTGLAGQIRVRKKEKLAFIKTENVPDLVLSVFTYIA